MNFRFFREHKYIIFELTEMLREVAKTNFNIAPEVLALEPKLAKLVTLLKNHSLYESKHVLSMLEDKTDISAFEAAQKEEQALFDELAQRFNALKLANNTIIAGDAFYVFFREFVAKSLLHMNEQERKLWPLLKANCTLEALQKIESEMYQRQSTEQLLVLVQTLFPHYNRDDKIALCQHLQLAVPEKWQKIAPEVQKIA